MMSDQRMPQITRRRAAGQGQVEVPPGRPDALHGVRRPGVDHRRDQPGAHFRFLKKPWQPEELESAVRQAAAEYDRLDRGGARTGSGCSSRSITSRPGSPRSRTRSETSGRPGPARRWQRMNADDRPNGTGHRVDWTSRSTADVPADPSTTSIRRGARLMEREASHPAGRRRRSGRARKPAPPLPSLVPRADGQQRRPGARAARARTTST